MEFDETSVENKSLLKTVADGKGANGARLHSPFLSALGGLGEVETIDLVVCGVLLATLGFN